MPSWKFFFPSPRPCHPATSGAANTPPVEVLFLACDGCKRRETHPWFGLVCLSKTPSGAFFLLPPGVPGLPRDQFSGPWLFSTAEARTINSSSSSSPRRVRPGSSLRELETSNSTPHCTETARNARSRLPRADESGVQWFICCIVRWCPLVCWCPFVFPNAVGFLVTTLPSTRSVSRAQTPEPRP